jgi:hypothetical protein
MDAKNPPVYDRPQTKIVKDVAAVPPHVARPVLPLTLVVESVHLRDLPRLVVAPDERYPVRVPDLKEEEEEKGLDGIEAAVDKVAWDFSTRRKRPLEGRC